MVRPDYIAKPLPARAQVVDIGRIKATGRGVALIRLVCGGTKDNQGLAQMSTLFPGIQVLIRSTGKVNDYIYETLTIEITKK